MQNHLEFLSKNQFWTRNVRNYTKSRDLVMSGTVQEDPYGHHKGPYGPQPGPGPNPDSPICFLRGIRIWSGDYKFNLNLESRPVQPQTPKTNNTT